MGWRIGLDGLRGRKFELKAKANTQFAFSLRYLDLLVAVYSVLVYKAWCWRCKERPLFLYQDILVCK